MPRVPPQQAIYTHRVCHVCVLLIETFKLSICAEYWSVCPQLRAVKPEKRNRGCVFSTTGQFKLVFVFNKVNIK